MSMTRTDQAFRLLNDHERIWSPVDTNRPVNIIGTRTTTVDTTSMRRS